MTTICLVMIVKDDNKILKRCFESVVNYLDYWVICDTDSTDRTKEFIRNYFKRKKIPGELVEHEWCNFNCNRTRAVQAAYNKADYLLLMDADFTFCIKDPNFKKTKLTSDSYFIKYEESPDYRQALLVNGKKKWRYSENDGSIICDFVSKTEIFDGFTFKHFADSNKPGFLDINLERMLSYISTFPKKKSDSRLLRLVKDYNEVESINCNSSARKLIKSGMLKNIEHAVVITIYNRIEYFKITLESLINTDTTNTLFILVDDKSSRISIRSIIDDFMKKSSTPAISVYKNINCGTYHSLKIGWSIGYNLGMKYLVNLDSDSVVKPNWINDLNLTYNKIIEEIELHVKDYNSFNHNNLIVSGFNNSKKQHQIIGNGNYYCLKSKINGNNIFYHRDLFPDIEKLLSDVKWYRNISNYIVKLDVPLICSRPSVVQRIDLNRTNCSDSNKDANMALDFYIEMGEFIYLPMLDCSGSDYYENSKPRLTLNELLTEANRVKEIKAVNSNGWFKCDIPQNLEKWDVHSITEFGGTYIKKEHARLIHQLSPFLSTYNRMIIGISTVSRKDENYLTQMMDSLISSIEDLRKVKIILQNSEHRFDSYPEFDAVIEKYSDLVKDNILIPVKTRKSEYKSLENLPPSYSDSQERIKWRSKQVLDYALLFRRASKLDGNYYLHLEDDIICQNKFDKSIYDVLETTDEWEILQFSTLGFIGFMFHKKDLLSIAEFFEDKYYLKPVDWLIYDWSDDYTYSCSLFQHIGTHSSLDGKIQNIQDKNFNK